MIVRDSLLIPKIFFSSSDSLHFLGHFLKLLVSSIKNLASPFAQFFPRSSGRTLLSLTIFSSPCLRYFRLQVLTFCLIGSRIVIDDFCLLLGVGHINPECLSSPSVVFPVLSPLLSFSESYGNLTLRFCFLHHPWFSSSHQSFKSRQCQILFPSAVRRKEDRCSFRVMPSSRDPSSAAEGSRPLSVFSCLLLFFRLTTLSDLSLFPLLLVVEVFNFGELFSYIHLTTHRPFF